MLIVYVLYNLACILISGNLVTLIDTYRYAVVDLPAEVITRR